LCVISPRALTRNQHTNCAYPNNPPDSIFHDPGTGILFASFKYVGTDYAGDMVRMGQNPKVREWWRMTDGMQESLVPGATSSEAGEPAWWRGVEEVFYVA
jgi:L-rhamnose mutarotase